MHIEDRKFAVFGNPSCGLVEFWEKIKRLFLACGHIYCGPYKIEDTPQLVFHFIKQGERVRYLRRDVSRPTWPFSIAVIEAPFCPGARDEVLGIVYPTMIDAHAPLGMLVHFDELEAHVVGLEQSHFVLANSKTESFWDSLYERLRPIFSSRFVIAAEFVRDLPEELWEGNELTRQIGSAGRTIDSWGLLPAPFPIDRHLTELQRRRLKKMFGVGGISYGNMSCRFEGNEFFMSCTGRNKAKLEIMGKDIVLVRGCDLTRNVRTVSVPPNTEEPEYPSVDAIEHWLIYKENPEVGAIIHVHGWIEGVPSTQIPYPCGTYELGRAVADLVRSSPDPVGAVVGLKNHGLTLTGHSLPEILQRVEGKILKEVPMDERF